MTGQVQVLVLEDNDWNLELITAIIESIGYEVTAARTGAEALGVVISRSFDVLVLDISLPDMDGFEVTRRIRQNPAIENLPILAVTAHALAHTRETAMAAGCDGFVTKPVDRIDFLEHFNECISPGRGKRAS